jgi:hypothetical protein
MLSQGEVSCLPRPRLRLRVPEGRLATLSLWLTMVEWWFREITDKRTRCDMFRNVPVLIIANKNHIDNTTNSCM